VQLPFSYGKTSEQLDSSAYTSEHQVQDKDVILVLSNGVAKNMTGDPLDSVNDNISWTLDEEKNFYEDYKTCELITQ